MCNKSAQKIGATQGDTQDSNLELELGIITEAVSSAAEDETEYTGLQKQQEEYEQLQRKCLSHIHLPPLIHRNSLPSTRRC